MMPSPTITFLFLFRYLLEMGTIPAKSTVPDFHPELLFSVPLERLLPMTDLIVRQGKGLKWLPMLFDHYYRTLFNLRTVTLEPKRTRYFATLNAQDPQATLNTLATTIDIIKQYQSTAAAVAKTSTDSLEGEHVMRYVRLIDFLESRFEELSTFCAQQMPSQ